MKLISFPNPKEERVRHISKKRILNLGSLLFFLFIAMVIINLAQEHMGKGRITGTVIDEEGNPLESVLIIVESLEYTTKIQGYSNKKGHFAVAGMGTGNWRIIASKEGYSKASLDMNVRQLRKNPPVKFTLKKTTGVAAFMPDEKLFKMFDKGNLLIKEEKYDEALEIFEELLEKYPKIYHIHLNIGTCCLTKGDLDKAEAEFKFVLDKIMETLGDYKQDSQTSLTAFKGLGEVYIREADFEMAKECFTKALEISPEDEVNAYNVGEIFFSNQKIEEAIEYFELAIRIKKDWSSPFMKLGYVYLNKGDFNKSLDYFNKFLEMDPENPEVPQVKNIIATIQKMIK